MECSLCSSQNVLNLGKCIPQGKILNCQLYDNTLDRCVSCLPGFQLNATYYCNLPTPPITQGPTSNSTQNTPIPSTLPSSPSPQQRDRNCRQYNGSVCLNCSNQFYFSAAGNKCIPVNPVCKDHISTGQCSSCYPGYILQSGSCIIQAVVISNCQKASLGGLCEVCFANFFLRLGKC